MKHLMLSALGAGLFVAGSAALFATGTPTSPDLPRIETLNALMQRRFEDPAPKQLGMSRAVRPTSFGTHYQPSLVTDRDFTPENYNEAAAIQDLEAHHALVGFYLFGAAITTSEPAAMNFRAFKGPAAMTKGTLRPEWYPPAPRKDDAKPNPEALPDWEAMYPIARKAMKSFQDGGSGFETTLGAWNIAARPVLATQKRCVDCHNAMAPGKDKPAKTDKPLGGFIYAYRRAS